MKKVLAAVISLLLFLTPFSALALTYTVYDNYEYSENFQFCAYLYPNKTTALVKWTRTPKVKGYLLEFKSTGQWISLPMIEPNADHYFHKGLKMNTTYRYRLCAVYDDENPGAEVDWYRASVVGVTTPSAKAPNPIQITNVTSSKANALIKWKKPSGVKSVDIYYSEDGQLFYKLASSSGTSYTDRNVYVGNRYYYMIRGKNSYGTGPFGNTKSVMIKGDNTSPIKLRSVWLTTRYFDSSTQLNMIAQNVSKSVTIDAFSIEAKCYDTKGKLVKAFGKIATYKETQRKTLMPGGIFNSDDSDDSDDGMLWFFGTNTVKVCITKYHIKSGKTITIPSSKRVWVSGRF